jgi:hypothetical protein
MRRALLLLAIGLTLAAPVAVAQRVTLQADVDHPSVAALRQILDSGRYLLLDRDTILPASTVLPDNLVVVGATVRLDGRVNGSVAVLNGTFFLRPGSHVSGEIVSVGGIVLRSGRATSGDTISVPLEVEVNLERGGGDYLLTLTPPPPPGRIRPAGLFGLAPPTYQRVDALSLRAGVGVRLGADSLAPVLRLSPVLRTARWSVGGTAALDATLGRGADLILAAGRETRTSDLWTRGDLENSAAAFFVRSDARDYYDSDFASLTLADRPAPPLISGETAFTPRVELRVERARSLTARDVFTVLGNDPWRSNPHIDEGRIASIIPGATLEWRGITAAGGITADVEVGRSLSEGSWTEGADFAQLVADGHWSMVSLWQHTVGVRAHYLQPLGSERAPRQRWSAVGGSTTLPTLDFDAFRGDHLLFVQSSYDIPLPRLAIPFLGVPDLGIRHAIGSAWRTDGPSPRWTQNLGAGLVFRVGYVFVYVDPADTGRTVVSYGITLP